METSALLDQIKAQRAQQDVLHQQLTQAFAAGDEAAHEVLLGQLQTLADEQERLWTTHLEQTAINPQRIG